VKRDWSIDVASADDAGNDEDALLALYCGVDEMLRDGEFYACDEAIGSIKLESRSTVVLLGLLSITRTASDKLASRDAMAKKVCRIIHERDPARETELLRGLCP